MEIAAPISLATYKDLVIRIIVSVLAAHFIVTFGEDKTFFEFLLLGDYYKSVAGSAIIAFILFSLVRAIIMRLDAKFPWHEVPLKRILLQVLLGLILVSITAFLLAAVYFRFYGINILTTVYLKYDFPVIVLFVLLLNVYYFCYYLVQQVWFTNKADNKQALHEEKYAVVFVVNKGTDNLPVPVDNISSFYHDGAYNFIRLFDGGNYLIAQTLDELEKQVDPRLFFRINRQIIINYKSCKSFRTLEYGKLEVVTEPEMREPAIVSQKRSAVFKKWLERKAA